jgi:septin family protein
MLSKIRPFNFQEFFKLVELCDKHSNDVKGKDIILLLGTTGAGKSTTIQYLFGANMVNKKGHIQADPMPIKLKTFIASAAMKSETRYINPIEFEVNIKGKNIKIMMVDTPGFGDTQSIEVDIANSLGIIRAVIKANSVRPVFLFNQKNMGQKYELMK